MSKFYVVNPRITLHEIWSLDPHEVINLTLECPHQSRLVAFSLLTVCCLGDVD
jgi:hypothetical protein